MISLAPIEFRASPLQYLPNFGPLCQCQEQYPRSNRFNTTRSHYRVTSGIFPPSCWAKTSFQYPNHSRMNSITFFPQQPSGKIPQNVTIPPEKTKFSFQIAENNLFLLKFFPSGRIKKWNTLARHNWLLSKKKTPRPAIIPRPFLASLE